MTPHEFAQHLSEMAEGRLHADDFGIVGGVVTASGPQTFAVEPAAVSGQESLADAWSRVRGLLLDSGATTGGVAADLALVEEGDSGEGNAYEVQVETTDGEHVVAITPYRRRRLRGLQVGGAVFTEPEVLWLQQRG